MAVRAAAFEPRLVPGTGRFSVRAADVLGSVAELVVPEDEIWRVDFCACTVVTGEIAGDRRLVVNMDAVGGGGVPDLQMASDVTQPASVSRYYLWARGLQYLGATVGTELVYLPWLEAFYVIGGTYLAFQIGGDQAGDFFVEAGASPPSFYVEAWDRPN